MEDDLHAVHDTADRAGVADVTANEGVAWITLDVRQALEMPSIGERVEVDHLRVGSLG